MVIAVEKGLEHMKQLLESRGYECFYIGENRVADAILYKDRVNHPYFNVNKGSMTNISGPGASQTQAALLINADNKNIDDIVNILERRTYSPLI